LVRPANYDFIIGFQAFILFFRSKELDHYVRGKEEMDEG